MKRIFYILIAILSLVGGVLLVVTPFGEWIEPPFDYWYYAGADTFYGVLIVPVALLLFYCSAIYIIQIIAPGKLPEIMEKLVLYFSLTAFTICALGGIFFQLKLAIDNPTDWWFGPGFYGGVIASPLTALFTFLVQKE